MRIVADIPVNLLLLPFQNMNKIDDIAAGFYGDTLAVDIEPKDISGLLG
jgi:hypothetical protein